MKIYSDDPVNSESPAQRLGERAPVRPRGGVSGSLRDLSSLLSVDGNGDSNKAVFRSATMQDIYAKAKRFAKSTATVLITGESGTGKEVIARVLHESSSRAKGSYVRVNCAALSETLIESELFGHERGAFTGAVDSRPGRFEWANGGTLLLDEISEIPIGLQAKLLRVLEEEEYERVGGRKTYRVDVRVVATSNRMLEQEVADKKFRADLYYRLNILHIQLPPLRHRRDDIAELSTHFFRQFRSEAMVPITSIADETMELLYAYDWPGNVRQLRNVIHHACLVASSQSIQPADLPALESLDNPIPENFFGMTLDEIERHVIVSYLRRNNGNKTAAARELGVTSRTLSNKMKRYRQLGYAA